jgi:splicing factor 1
MSAAPKSAKGPITLARQAVSVELFPSPSTCLPTLPLRLHLLTTSLLHQHIAANMAWRNQGITGSNNIPLGKSRRGFGDADDGGYNPAEPSAGLPELKRGRSPTRGESFTMLSSFAAVLTCPEAADGPVRRKKRNRWGDASENKAAGLMGLPTAIYAAMTTEQLDAYTLHLRIEEITQKLKINDVVPADGDRYV